MSGSVSPTTWDEETAPDRERWTRWALAGAVLHFLLALLFSAVVPPWEAHDEWAHYKYVEYVALHKRLPPPDRRLTTEFEYDEANQPPLYYILAAIPVALALPHDDYEIRVNPYATTGYGQGGVNMALHDPEEESFPWRGTILALHLARLVSVLLGTLGLWFTWKLALLLAPGQYDVAAWAVILHGLTPQYIFIGSVVTNDILLAVLTAATFYLLVRVALEPFSWRLSFFLGATLALALLTKYLALALLPPALIVLVIAITRHRTGRVRWLAPLTVGGLILLIGGLWGYYNLRHTGLLLPRDPYAIEVVTTRSLPELLQTLPWTHIPHALKYGFRTIWASFGWGNVDPGVGETGIFLLLILGGLGGWIRDIRRKRVSPQTWFILGLWTLTAFFVIALPLLRELLHRGNILRGRYVLGLLAPLSAWVARGWAGWGLRRWAHVGTWGLTLGLTLLNLYNLFGVITPAYRPQGLLSEAQARHFLADQTFHPTYVRFDQAAELRGYRLLSPPDLQVGEWLEVELLWHVQAPLRPDHAILVQLLGRQERVYGLTVTYPAKGTYPTHLWKPNTWFVERYWLQVHPNGPLPTGARVAVGLAFEYEKDHFRYQPAYDQAGRRVRDLVPLLRVRVAADEEHRYPLPSPLCAIQARVGNARLLGITYPRYRRVGQSLPIDFHWLVEGSFAGDRTLFLHLTDATGKPIVTGDSLPVEGDFPTSLWRAGDRFIDPHYLPLPPDLPPGEYPLLAGLYDPTTGEREPVWDAAGHPVPGRAVRLGRLTVDSSGKATLECVGSPSEP